MFIVPRDFARVLSDAMNGLATVWKTLLWPSLVVFVPVSIGTIFVFGATGGAEFLDQVLNRPESLQTLPEEVFWELAEPFVVAVGLAVALQFVAGVFVALASHHTVAGEAGGKPITASRASRMALNGYHVGLGAATIVVAVTAILIGLGGFVWLAPALAVGTPNLTSQLVALLLLAALLGPGVWAGVSASMTTPVVAIESAGVLSSIRRSMHLVRGRWWATAGFLLVVGFFGGVATLLIQLVALPMVAVGDIGVVVGITAAVGVLAQGPLVAAMAAMHTRWYIDLRARTEEVSTRSLG